MTPAATTGPSMLRGVERTVVIIDPDRLSSMLIARALERSGCAIEIVATGVAALEILATRLVAMVVTEVQLPDLPLASLVSRMRQLYTPMIPVVAVSASVRQPQRLEAIRLGVELMSKPVDPEELRARMELALRAPTATAMQPGMLSGDLAAFALHDVFTMLDLARFTGQVQVASGREVGTCYTVHGRPYHAEFAKLVGIEAFAAIIRLARGWFRVQVGASTERTITGSMTQVMLGAAVDEAHRRRTPSANWLRLEELEVTKHTATAADPERARLARRLEIAVGDAFRLGELEVGVRSSEPRDGHVLEIAMFGELGELVAGLWEVSAPVSPEALVAVTRPGAALAWRFAGRQSDRLVVRLIGLEEPTASWYTLVADGTIVVPPPSGRALDPALRPYVHRDATPVVIAGESRHERLFSPAPFTPIRVTGAGLQGQTRTVLRAVLAMIGEGR